MPKRLEKLHTIKSGATCPMCESANIRKEVQAFYDPYCFNQINFLVNTNLSRCGNCGLNFFDKTQSALVTRRILAKLRRIKLADTKKLAKKHEYQYS
ncbi:MAG: hypothetical protein A3J46_02310 [Candidatus Yanofskybacteria bacterium RIFCSPHIGHO2_02_FULL_41_11]|uniref:YgiT-type zinc finger protein n=1 Tax=Candidatus Yanofskybacteria bacterium RIFCSPHIGHO2_02_FULL_41_11 TaxID=1802675 RepID=A0A1F8FAH4_9BACT|nr:MAG: hypothetical protein A3J46_02310 [Candidatus Yanofskybacteria bacterium RIFCSPHIGHO2_02_FULL_41_11]